MATLGSMFWLSEREAAALPEVVWNDLTITPRRGLPTDPIPDPIEQWVERRGGRIGLPIDYALSLNLDFEDGLSDGTLPLPVRRLPDPNHSKASAGQEDFFREVHDAVVERETVLAEAPTGSGKTVTALNTAGRLRKATVIIVPSRVLGDQWVEEGKTHLGLEASEIGFVGDGREDWEGKPFVVVILHNLFLKRYRPEFYKQFGFAIWDEVHNLGAREFSKTMHCFPARYKLGLTATPDRKDGCAPVFINYFGPVAVKSAQENLPTTVAVIPFNPSPIPGNLRFCNNPTKAIKFLATHEKRNEMLANVVCWAYDRGRQILVLTKHIEHAEEIIRLIEQAGVPIEEVGQFTGKYTDVDGKQKKTKKEMLDRIKRESQVVVATYSMMREGVDIPRLDFGLEAIPVADARQAIGRIRRPLEGKPEPVWFTVEDKVPAHRGMDFIFGFTKARLRGFNEVGATVQRLREPPTPS